MRLKQEKRKEKTTSKSSAENKHTNKNLKLQSELYSPHSAGSKSSRPV
jgi:hypothetical protein